MLATIQFRTIYISICYLKTYKITIHKIYSFTYFFCMGAELGISP